MNVRRIWPGIATLVILTTLIGRHIFSGRARVKPCMLRDAPASALRTAFDPKKLSSYAFDASIPAAERIQDMPAPLLQLWRETDQSPGYRPYRPNPQERQAWIDAVRGLPPKIQKVLDERLIAVYFISNLRGNGITDWALDSSSRVYVYTVLNPAVFHETLSATLTQRDLSVFRGSASVIVDAGQGGSGILYSVTHEFTHAFDYVVGLTPYPEVHMAAALSRPTNVSWDAWASYFQPKPENDFPIRARLKFYGFEPPQLEASEAAAAYTQLSNSPFASLYGAKNWADDAAELSVFRHITTDLRRPYRIRVRRPDGTETVFEPMSNPRVKDRATRILAPLY